MSEYDDLLAKVRSSDVQPDNEYSDLLAKVRGQDVTQAAIYGASFKTPANEIEKHRLSLDLKSKFGEVWSPAVIDPPQDKRRILAAEMDHIYRQSPDLQRWALDDPENAAIVGLDDAKRFAGISKMVANFPGAVASGLTLRQGESAYSLLALPFDLGHRAAQALGMEGSNTQSPIGQYLRGKAGEVGDSADWMESLAGKAEGNIEGGVKSGASSLGSSAFSLGTGLLTRDPIKVSLGMMGLLTGGKSYLEGMDKTGDPLKSALHGTEDALAEVATEAAGVGALFKIPGLKMGAKEIAKRVGEFALKEGLGEQVATVWQDFNAWANLNPEKTLDEFIAERPDAAIQTAIATLVAGGGQIAIMQAVGAQRRAETQAVFDALHQAGEGSDLREKLPEKYREFVARATKDGPVANVFIPAEKFTTYFQAMGIDPMQAAADLNAENYSEALAAKSDVMIPTADFATLIAGTDHYAGLSQDLRLHQGDLTAREAAEYQANSEANDARLQQQIDQLIEEGKKAEGLNAAIDTVVRDVEGQLIASGVERGTAQRQALLYRGVAVLAQRAFPDMDPVQASEQLWGKYNLQIRRDLPAILTQLKEANLEVDPLLDMLRGKGGPTDQATFGTSLVEFLRGRGGLQSIGELLDVASYPTPAGQRKLITDAGMTLDDAALLAQEYGYFQSTDHTALVDAILTELNGTPAYSMQQTDERAMGVQQSLEMLNQAVKDAGIDLNAVTDNAEVRRRLEQSGKVAGARFDQGEGRVPSAIGGANSESQGNPQAAPAGESYTAFKAVDTESAEFKAWSGGAPIKSEGFKTGEAVVIRGQHASTYGDITEFKTEEQRFGKAGYGFYFSDAAGANLFAEYGDKFQMARSAAGEEKAVKTYPVFISMRNPLVVDHVDDLKPYLDPGQKFGVARGIFGNLSPEAITKLQKQGYDGIISRETTAPKVHKTQGLKILDRNDPKATSFPVFVAFEPTQIKSAISNTGAFSATNPSILKQGGDSPRAYLQIGTDRQMQIGLTDNANLSSFLHETGHFYLEMLGDLAEMDGVAQNVKDDYAAILKWLGVESRAQITVEHHEMFARGNEAYLMEGKAPSPELRNAFQRFTAWLKSIYKELKNLNVELSDEVRGVFDRIYATDAEIKAAAQEVDISPLSAEFMRARMSESEYTAYLETAENIIADAKETLQLKLMREFRRGQLQWWKDQRGNVRKEVAAEIDALPAYAAFNAMMAGDKLSKSDLEYRYGGDFVKNLPRGFGRIYALDGMSLDVAAVKFGFESGDAMIKALAEMKPRKELIEAETDYRMRERHGDILTDGSIADEAINALHNDRRADMLAVELKALGSRVVRDQVKRAAEAAIGRTRHMNIKPYGYLLAGRKAAREAFASAVSGDLEGAAQAKERELLNHYLHQAATDAVEESARIQKHMKKLANDAKLRGKIGKAGQEWLGQIDDILVRFSFSPIARTMKSRSLAEWAQAEEEQTGEVIALSPLVMNEANKTNWREMTMDELRAIDDSLKSIEHVAKKIQEVMLNGQRYEFEEIVAKIKETAGRSKFKDWADRRPGDDATLGEKFRAIHYTMLRPEKIIELLDGGKTGLFHDLLWDRAITAQVLADDLKKQVMLPLEKLVSGMSRDDEIRMKQAIRIDALNASLTRYEMVGIVLNAGNAGNLDKLQRGGIVLNGESPTKISDAALTEIKAALSQQDYAMIRTLWDTIEQLYPHLNDLNQRAVGLPLKKIDPITVETPFGPIRGGYWPAVGDPRYSHVGETQENSNSVSAADFFPQPFSQAATKHSFREGRTAAVYPLSFDWRKVVSRHVAQATTDIAYHEFAKESSRIIKNGTVRAALTKKIGDDQYKGVLDWLKFQVDATMGGLLGTRPVDGLMQAAISNTAVAALGYKIATAIGNIVVAPVQASHQIKGRFMAQGMMEFMRSPKKALEMVREMSGEMRFRHDHLDATFNQVLDQLAGTNTLRTRIMRNAMQIHTVADTIATTGLWLGKYRQSVKEGMTDAQAVKAADKMIRTSQTAGAPKDLSAFERDPKYSWAKLFLGPMIIMQNEMRGSMISGDKRLQTMLATWLIPAILFEIAVGRGPDDDEEPEEWALRKVLLYPLQTIPLVRDAASVLDAAMSGKPGMSRMNPVAELLSTIVKSGKKLMSDTADEGDKVQAAAQLTGVAGMPGNAAGQFLNYVTDVATGRVEVESPIDLRFLFIRRPDDKND